MFKFEIVKIAKEKPRILACEIKKLDIKLYQYINNKYQGNTMSEKIYQYVYGKKICSVCVKNKPRFYNFNRGYGEYCSNKCRSYSKTRIQKIKQTKFERYGNENYINKEKIKETNKKRYGTDWVVQSDHFKDKYKKFCIKKWGVDNASKSIEIKDKIRKNTNYIETGKNIRDS